MLNKNKVYIASPIKSSVINNDIADAINNYTNFVAFLPELLNVQDSIETIDFIASKCYEEIEASNIILIISPFGLGTAAEIGYSIRLKKEKKDLEILMYNPNKFKLKIEATIHPFIDQVFYTKNDLIHYLNFEKPKP